MKNLSLQVEKNSEKTSEWQFDTLCFHWLSTVQSIIIFIRSMLSSGL